MKQGNIVVLPVPFTDLSSQKLRPCLIVSNKTLKNDDVIVAVVTSSTKQKKEPLSVKITSKNLAKGHIPKISYVRCHKVFCLHKSLIHKKVATLDTETLKKVQEKLWRVLE